MRYSPHSAFHKKPKPVRLGGICMNLADLDGMLFFLILQMLYISNKESSDDE
jgi:hypothetical protein